MCIIDKNCRAICAPWYIKQKDETFPQSSQQSEQPHPPIDPEPPKNPYITAFSTVSRVDKKPLYRCEGNFIPNESAASIEKSIWLWYNLPRKEWDSEAAQSDLLPRQTERRVFGSEDNPATYRRRLWILSRNAFQTLHTLFLVSRCRYSGRFSVP